MLTGCGRMLSLDSDRASKDFTRGMLYILLGEGRAELQIRLGSATRRATYEQSALGDEHIKS